MLELCFSKQFDPHCLYFNRFYRVSVFIELFMNQKFHRKINFIEER